MGVVAVEISEIRATSAVRVKVREKGEWGSYGFIVAVEVLWLIKFC
jgi:hypothetical protein